MNAAQALAHPYLQNALAAGLLVSILAGCLGYFVVLRGAAFATHAVSQIGFAGAAAAVLVGASPLLGLLVFAIGGALAIGVLSIRSRASDVTTALVLVFALGAGALFLSLARSYATDVFSLLFGTIVGIDRGEVALTAAATLVVLLALAAIARPLLFSTVSTDAAALRGVPVAPLDVTFLVIVAVATAVTVPIVGTLLIYSLAIGPAAAAAHLSARPARTIGLAIVFAAFAVVFGIALADATGWPVGFFISAIAAAEYVGARTCGKRLRDGRS